MHIYSDLQKAKERMQEGTDETHKARHTYSDKEEKKKAKSNEAVNGGEALQKQLLELRK